ncbi:2-keto-4-pentenoate hydratase [Candidatus Foliamicus sp.]
MTLKQAYAIQSASISRWPDEVAAWKVARLSSADRKRFSAERLAGPAFKSLIRAVEPGSSEVMAIYKGGFAAIEAEYALELGVTVPPSGKDYSDEELADLVRAVYGAAEIASSPLARVSQLGAMSVISDFGANAGLVVGPRIFGWRSLDPGALSVSVAVDDVGVGEASPGAIAGDPLQALRFLIGLSASRGIALPEGALISTGALTGVHEVQLSSTVRVDFGAFGCFDVRFEPAAPKR